MTATTLDRVTDPAAADLGGTARLVYLAVASMPRSVTLTDLVWLTDLALPVLLAACHQLTNRGWITVNDGDPRRYTIRSASRP